MNASKALERQIVTERADQITPRKLRWLWPERIPLGKVTVFAGLPGEGKSLATVDLAARVTTASKYPDSENPLSASEVLFAAREDDPEDALVPRLMAAGADMSKVHVLKAVRVSGQANDRGLRLDMDMAAVKRFLDSRPDVRLIVIDPVSNHLGDVSMVDEQEVRTVLSHLAGIASVHDLAIVGVMHLNKKEGLSAIHRVGGAGAFIGVARASWLFARVPEKCGERFMMPLKNNYARQSSSLGYQIDEKAVKIESENVPTPYIEWLNPTFLDVDEAISTPGKRTSSRDDAKSFLKGFLAGGPRDASDVYATAEADGIAKRTLDRAKADLRVESRKKGAEGWEWAMPDGEQKSASEGQGEAGAVGILQLSSVGRVIWHSS